MESGNFAETEIRDRSGVGRSLQLKKRPAAFPLTVCRLEGIAVSEGWGTRPAVGCAVPAAADVRGAMAGGACSCGVSADSLPDSSVIGALIIRCGSFKGVRADRTRYAGWRLLQPFPGRGGSRPVGAHWRLYNGVSAARDGQSGGMTRLRDADSRHVGSCGYSLCGTARSASPESFAGWLPRIEYMASAFPVRPPWKGFSSFFSGERAKKL